jgi:hypothetical protein
LTTLRQKREREFQRRVLAAVERPKRGRLLAIINSSFFIWLMSVLFLTIGGSYVTNHRQCLDDAEKIISRREHLRQELRSRDVDYYRRVAKANTLQEAELWRDWADKRGSIFTDLANLTYREVHGEYAKLGDRIRYEEFDDLAIEKFRSNYGYLFVLYWSSPSPTDDEAHSLKLKKLDAKAFLAIQGFHEVLEFLGYEFWPDCSVSNTAAIAVGYRVPIVFASTRKDPQSLKEGPVGLEQTERDIEEAEQAKKDAQSFEGKPH